jgi:uncharacterized membrane-anchored protein YjiN (DUF445 family)
VFGPDGAGWVGYVEAASEAAMVGGLADWFAVTAIFRRPFGLPIPHTGIIPNRKNEIGRSLGVFVQENFLQPDALGRRVAEAHPARSIVTWLRAEGNAAAVTSNVLRAAGGVAAVLDADEVTLHLQHAVTEAVQHVDTGPLLASLAETVMAEGRADEILAALLGSVVRTLDANRDTLRLGFAVRSPWWVPGSVDERVFEKLFSGIVDLLREVRADPRHELRASLLAQADQLVARLRSDPAMQAKVASVRDQALAHPNVAAFVRSAWDTMCSALQRAGSPVSGAKLSEWDRRGQGLVLRAADTLHNDAALQAKVDAWIATFVQTVVADHGHRAADWISSTVEQWDATDTSDLIEVQIGKDLQFVRINGTAVGALVGVLIYTMGQLIG